MAVAIVCKDCGSDDVSRDAWACWNVERQDWVLQAVFDAGFCQRCGEEATLAEQSLNGSFGCEAPTAAGR